MMVEQEAEVKGCELKAPSIPLSKVNTTQTYAKETKSASGPSVRRQLEMDGNGIFTPYEYHSGRHSYPACGILCVT